MVSVRLTARGREPPEDRGPRSIPRTWCHSIKYSKFSGVSLDNQAVVDIRSNADLDIRVVVLCADVC